MSGAGLFVIGVLVTLIVATALGLLVYAAILDGRDETARRLPVIDGGRSASSTPIDEEQPLREPDGDPTIAA